MAEWTVKAVDGVDQNDAPTAQEQEQAIVEEAIADNPNVEIQGDADVIKVNLDEPVKQEEDAVQQVQGEAEESVLRDEGVEDSSEAQEEAVEAPQEEEQVIELVSEEPEAEQATEAPVEETIQETHETAEIPEGLDSLVKFMEETGGTLEDYVSLNKNFDDLSPVDLIKDYYTKKYPHYSEERIDRKMNKEFFYDEGDDPDVIQDRKDSFEDKLYEAKDFLKSSKDKYYADLKLSKQKNASPETQEAIEHYNQFRQNQEESQKLSEAFNQKTNKLFNEEFKGFDFKVGDSKYRFKVSDVQKTKEYQSDLNNFVSDFVGDDGLIDNVAGYHKALFAAKNADKIAQHFYEQGKADAIKNSAKQSKNIDMKPRGDSGSFVQTKSGTQVRAVSGDSSSKLRFKVRQ